MRALSVTTVVLATLVTISCADGPAEFELENAPPAVTITSPASGSFFSGGTSTTIRISATDPEDGTLSGGSVTWWGVLHHDTHTHPFLPQAAGTSGSIDFPDVGHLDTDIWYRFHARAEDSEGLADTTFVDVDPNLVTMTVQTVPPGLRVAVDGIPLVTPAEVESVVGMLHSLAAWTPQSLGAFAWSFDSWSQGGEAEQIYRAPPTDVTLVATYSEAGPANVPPTVSITSPSDGGTVTTGVQVPVTAEASDADGSVAAVQFLEGTTVIGTDNEAPYGVQWTPAGLGTRTLTARATDDFGETTTSAAVDVTVQASGSGDVVAPVTTIVSPVDGTRNLVGSVTVSATATDDVGVTQVEFQFDGETLAVDDTAPYEATLPSTGDYASGAHTFRARARDAAGNWSPWARASVTFGGSVSLPANFTRETFVTGFNSFVTTAAFSPDGRLFALEKEGSVRVVKDGQLLATPFVTLPVVAGGEMGLLGIAFDPGFSSNGHVYLYYTTTEGGSNFARISRFTANGDVAAAASEVVLVELDALSAVFHVGGAMAFGPDGKLYVAVGDNVQGDLSQSLSSRFGKILRYNPDGTIPSDNPFFGSASGDNRAIWALGLRNPFTFAIQPGTGRMHINDVGGGAWEEVNHGIAGANYGWPTTEGPTDDPAFTPPILAIAHWNSPTLFEGRSIVGAGFYNPTTNLFGDAYTGDYFFADFIGGWVYRLDSDQWDTAYAFAQLETFGGCNLFAPEPGCVINLLVGDDGALYVLVDNRVDRISR